MRALFHLIKWLLILAVIAVGAAFVIGSALPATHEASRSARIETPRQAIFDVLNAPGNYPDWRPDVQRIELLGDDRFREYGAEEAVTFKIAERFEPARLVIAVDDPEQPFTGTWTFDLQPEGAQGEFTRIRITERGEVAHPIYRAMARVMMSPAEGLEQYLRNLGRRFGQEVRIEP